MGLILLFGSFATPFIRVFDWSITLDQILINISQTNVSWFSDPLLLLFSLTGLFFALSIPFYLIGLIWRKGLLISSVFMILSALSLLLFLRYMKSLMTVGWRYPPLIEGLLNKVVGPGEGVAVLVIAAICSGLAYFTSD